MIRAKIQEQFKNTSIIKFHENETKNIRAKYKIQIQSVWKGNKLIQNHHRSENIKRMTNTKSHIEALIYTKLTKCALSLTVGKKYILSGNMVEDKLYVSKCHWHILWNTKSKKIRRNLRKGDFHCRCVIEPCFSDHLCKNNDPFVCYWPITFKPRNCRFRSCKYAAGGCRWNKNVDMDLYEE